MLDAWHVGGLCSGENLFLLGGRTGVCICLGSNAVIERTNLACVSDAEFKLQHSEICTNTVLLREHALVIK